MKTTIFHPILLTCACTLLLTSCATPEKYNGGVQPVSPIPPLANARLLTTVKSLQPTLSWKSVGSNGSKYDVMICTGIGKPPGLYSNYYNTWKQGVEVYYREGIEGCSHQVEQPLEPNTVYVWSVRKRSGANVGPWCTYDFQVGSTSFFLKQYGYYIGHNVWWAFITPKK
jgi:hypothetical protein